MGLRKSASELRRGDEEKVNLISISCSHFINKCCLSEGRQVDFPPDDNDDDTRKGEMSEKFLFY